ncbi:MAG TPA: TonB-dependent siderophore receptor [Novosphingobium sp.]|nr:TonB-dependent siderophore receptor [Novosphingobium sp.]
MRVNGWVLGVAAAAMATGAIAGVAPAARAQAAGTVDFAIGAGSLGAVLGQFGQQAQVMIAFDPALVRGMRSGGLKGRFTTAEALVRLLAGTGLRAAPDGAGGYVLSRAPAAAEAAPVEEPREIVVLGKGYGIEVGGKSVTPLKEVPNTVTVVDGVRIREQNLFTITDLATQTVGLTVTGGDSDLAQFMTRGFTIDNYLVDGVPNNGFTGEIPDLFLYDRAEFLRGPAGLFSGSGSPAGSINLVRKRPLPELSVSALAAAGSWNNFRGELDVSAPVADGVGLRAGVAYQDRDQFYDVVHQSRLLAFGVADFALGEATRLTVGGHYDRYRGATFSGLPGLAGPAGQANPLPDLPRSTYASADWNRSDFDTKAGFAELRQELGDDWVVRLSGSYGKTDTDLVTSYALSFTGITPTDGEAMLLASRNQRKFDYLTADLNAVGHVALFGREHELLVGADYQRKTYDENFSDRAFLGSFDLYDPVYDVPEPEFPFTYVSNTRTRQVGVYGQAKLKPADPLTVVLGGRVNWYENRLVTRLPAGDPSTLKSNGRFVPYAGVVWDVTPQWSLYASFAESFAPQSGRTLEGEALRPVVGRQVEAGIKGGLFGNRLLLSAALYRIEQTGRPQPDPRDINFSVATGKVRSQGVELEANGEVLPGWRINGGYVYNDNTYLDDAALEGARFTLAMPAHSVKLWTSYQPQDGALARLSLGAGINWQSETEAFLTFLGGNTGARQPAYAVVNTRIGYDVTDKVTLALNVNNLFDKHYYERVSGTEFGNFYGAPRNVLATARLRY